MAGLRVIAVLDVARSGERMLRYGADFLVDRHDTIRATTIIEGITNKSLRFGLDTRGKESATLLASSLSAGKKSADHTSHLVGLTGLPEEPTEGTTYHTVPIKIFHEVPAIGEGLMVWLEGLLQSRLLGTPDIEVVEGGLEIINAALDRLREGIVNGPRIVVPLKHKNP
jgi:hypothetical protein